MIYFVKVIYLSAVRSEVCAVDSFGFPVIRGIDSCVMTSRRTHVDEIEIYASSKFWKSFGRYYRWQAFLVTSPYRCKNEFCSQTEPPEKEFVLEKKRPIGLILQDNIILPSVLYGLATWGGCSIANLQHSLEVLHLRAARLIYNLPRDMPFTEKVNRLSDWNT